MTFEAVRDTVLVKRLRKADTNGCIRGEILAVGPKCRLSVYPGEKVVFHGQFAEELAGDTLVIESPSFSIWGYDTREIDDTKPWHVCLEADGIYMEEDGESASCHVCQQLTVMRAQIALQIRGVETSVPTGKGKGEALGYSLDEFMSKPRTKEEIADAGIGLDDEMLQKTSPMWKK